MLKKSIYRRWKLGGKNYRKLTQKWPVINSLKNDPKVLKIWFAMGGSKLTKIDLGDPGPQNKNFLKFCSFLQKLPTFRPPKSTPINDAINFSFPTKKPVLLLRGGSKNVTFWGVGGRTARTENRRHYYIAKIAFRGSKNVVFYEIFTPATSPP
jgi:hypothetical protein